MEIICNINFRIRHIIFYLIILNLSLADSDTLKILNYNIYGLHPFYTSLFPGKFTDKDNSRIKSIFLESKKYDIVFFQENWSYQNLIKETMHNHQVIVAEKTNFIIKKNPKRSSGLNFAISEDIDVVSIEDNLFSDCNGYFSDYNDCLASKGFIYSLISKEKYKINLYVTHLDAGNTKEDILVREIQLKELNKHINSIDNNYPFILCGDFNIDYYESFEIIDEFVKNNNFNILRWDSIYETNKMIDYVFYKDGINAISIIDFDINSILVDKSDHLPIEFTIIVE